MASTSQPGDSGNASKRRKVETEDGSVLAVPGQQEPAASSSSSSPSSTSRKKQQLPKKKESEKEKKAAEKKKPYTIRKLVPPKPFPTISPADSATAARSSRKEGKNYICVTRKTGLGAYMRRCKDLIMKDG
jgi:ribonuclease P/MRP protein subunit RPP20